nr:asparagine synthase (glutamine-hydrolyzing) [uncultured Methanoregula sp.]
MCGISGIYRFDGNNVDYSLLKQMTDSVAHRGPDDDGQYIDKNVGLGHRRLSIIDLSSRGRQPISNEDGSVWIVYNGEIYNYRVLRDSLIQKGHRFSTDTDTEVIVHSYEEYGRDCLHYLKGMFGFAIWDSINKKMFLARDRLGIKPLFYYRDENKLLFGSEIKCLLCDPTRPQKVNLEALHHFLSLNYVPAPLTLFEGIRQLMPGQYMLVSKDGIEIKDYWDIRFTESQKKPLSCYEDTLDQILKRSVEQMMVSDVPFGVFLSGGLDSSTVTYYMSKILNKPVKSFSIGFEEESYNELNKARIVADHCGTDHFEEVVRPDNLEKLLPELVYHAEEPLADASMVPMYYLSKLASSHVKMVLCGDGADEIFAGYETYAAHHAVKAYRVIPSVIRKKVVLPIVDSLPVSDKKISLDYKVKRFVRGAEFDPEKAHYYWRIIFDENEKRKMYSDCIREKNAGLDTYEMTYMKYFLKTDANNPIDRLLYADTRFYLPNDMLVKVDRMSMAHSLEVRVPFLDHELVEYMATVPASLKLKNYTTKKYLLKRIVRDKLPRTIVHQKKQGFNLPVGLWIKTYLKDYAFQVLSDEQIKEMGYFRYNFINKTLSDHMSGRKDNGYQIWGLMTLSLWWERYIARDQ